MIKLCTATWIALALPGSGADWLRLHSSQFEILTDAGEKTGRDTFRRLDEIRQVFTTRDKGPLPLRIFLFGSEKEFRGYAENAVPDGFYQGGGERDLIVLHGGAGLTRTVTHEYIHLILDRGPSSLPLWFEEGTAELYSNLDLQRGRMIAGEPIAEHLSTLVSALAAGKWLDARQLIAANRRSPLYNERTLAGVFYAECWALAHLLNLAPGWRERMPRFAGMLAEGRDGNEAFPEAFGKNMDQAVMDLRSYVTRLRGVMLESPGRVQEEPVAVERLPSVEAMLARANLALQVRRPELALKLFEAAKKSQPDSPDAEAGIGAFNLAEDRRDEARAHLERAIAMGSRDASTYFQLAMLERDARASGQRVRALLHRALELDPDFAEVQLILGVQATEDADFETAVGYLRSAARVWPRHSDVWHALAFAQARLGQDAGARASASRAMKVAATPQEESIAQTLLDSLQ